MKSDDYNPMYKFSRAGFTLVELLVTIAVVGILATIAVSAYQTYKTQAQQARLKSFVHDIRVNLEVFKGELEDSPGYDHVRFRYNPSYTNPASRITTHEYSGFTPTQQADVLFAHMLTQRTIRFEFLLSNTGGGGTLQIQAFNCLVPSGNDNSHFMSGWNQSSDFMYEAGAAYYASYCHHL